MAAGYPSAEALQSAMNLFLVDEDKEAVQGN